MSKDYIIDKSVMYVLEGIQCSHCGGVLEAECLDKYNTITCRRCGIGTANEEHIDICIDKINKRYVPIQTSDIKLNEVKYD